MARPMPGSGQWLAGHGEMSIECVSTSGGASDDSELANKRESHCDDV